MYSNLCLLTFFLAAYLELCSSGGCPSGWQDAVGSCYAPMTDTSDFVHWGYAMAKCKQMDVRSRLPQFKDEMGWSVFQMGVKQIKAKFMDHTPPPGAPLPAMTIPFGAYKLNGEFYWADKSKVKDGVQKWQSGQPNGTDEKPENCLGFNPVNGDTGYGDIPCNDNYGFACQLDPSIEMPTLNNGGAQNGVMDPMTSCPDGWTLVGGVCYKKPDTDMDTSANGLAECAKLDPKAHLPEFRHSKDYDAFIRFIGKEIHAEHKDIALGGKKDGSTTDGTVYHLNWMPNEPSGKECIFTSDTDGYMWQTKDCSTESFIICQLDSRTVKTVAKAPPPQAMVSNPMMNAAAGEMGGGGGGGSNNAGSGGDGGGGGGSKSGSSCLRLNASMIFATILLSVGAFFTAS